MIFTLIGGLAAGALFTAGTIAYAVTASIISSALAIGASYLLNSYLNRPKKRKYTAVQGDLQFGADVPASTVFGTSKVKGHRINYFKWSGGNKWNADVLVLANGWCDGLEPEIYFYGEKHALISADKIGDEIEHWTIDGYEDILSIRFYDGRPNQPVDQKLVDDTANLGRKWKATSVVAGHAYVIVERKYSSKKFSKGRPDFDFILRGLREYDWRFDSTYPGGDGPQRIDDQSTWAHTLNPAVHRVNYLLGIKGLVSGRTLIGVGKSLAEIDMDSHTVAANVCDTVRSNGKKTYECSLFVKGDDTHTEILAEFEDAMAGYRVNRGGLSGIIVGAPQIPVAEITNADIRSDEGQQLSLRKSAYGRYNIISGQFTSKESAWEAESLKTVTVNADVAADKHKRQTSNDFLQVTDPDIAQYLLNIRYRQNRKGGSATVPVSRRLGLKCDPGTWVTYLDRTWLVTGRQFTAMLKCTLMLAETGSDVYSEEGIDPGPIVIPPLVPVNPSLLSTVQNFNVAAGYISGADGYDVPALTFTWDPPDDPTITAVRFEYQVDPDDGGDGTIFRDQCDDPEAGTYTTTKNVVSLKIYVARATITTVPARLYNYTGWKTTATESGAFRYPVSLDNIKKDLKDLQEFTGDRAREAIDEILRLSTVMAQASLAGFSQVQQIRREAAATRGEITAEYKEVITTAIGEVDGKLTVLGQRVETIEATIPDLATVTITDAITSRVETNEGNITSQGSAITAIQNALTGYSGASAVANAFGALDTRIDANDGDIQSNADAITALETSVGSVSANATFRMQSFASPGGGWSRIGAQARVNVSANWTSAAWYLDAKSDGTSRMVVVADQFIVTDGPNSVSPFIFTGGVAYLKNLKVQFADIDNVNITSGLIAASAVTSSDDDSGSNGDLGTAYTTIAQITLSSDSGKPVLLYYSYTITAQGGSLSGKTTDVRIIRTSDSAIVASGSVTAGTNSNQSKSGSELLLHPVPGAGTYTYRIQAKGSSAAGVTQSSASGSLIAQCNRK